MITSLTTVSVRGNRPGLASSDTAEENTENVYGDGYAAKYIFCHRFQPLADRFLSSLLNRIAGKPASAYPEHRNTGKERAEREKKEAQGGEVQP